MSPCIARLCRVTVASTIFFVLTPAANAQDAVPATVTAETAGSAARPAQRPIGDDTRAILSAQREGTQAGPLLPLSGEVAAIGYVRYLNGFSYPLPEFLGTQTSGSALRGNTGNTSSMSAPLR